MNILTKKHNIWYEYAMLKRAIKENITLLDFSDSHHIPNQEMRVFFKTFTKVYTFLKSNYFYYSILVDTKFQNPFSESKF